MTIKRRARFTIISGNFERFSHKLKFYIVLAEYPYINISCETLAVHQVNLTN